MALISISKFGYSGIVGFSASLKHVGFILCLPPQTHLFNLIFFFLIRERDFWDGSMLGVACPSSSRRVHVLL